MITQPPKDRMLKPDHRELPTIATAASPARPPLVVVRKPATVRDVLGRDPKASVRAGATGLVRVPETSNLKPSTSR